MERRRDGSVWEAFRRVSAAELVSTRTAEMLVAAGVTPVRQPPNPG